MEYAAVVDDELCNPDRCNKECIRFDPLNRSPTGPEGFRIDDETGKARIPEEVVTEGHKISASKCPFGAIKLIKLEKDLGKEVHRYGENGFRLHNLPVPREGDIVGVLGRNGTGKSTALKILAGEVKPNLGREASWDEIIKFFRGSELQPHFEQLADKELDVSFKPQRIEELKSFSASAEYILEEVGSKDKNEDLINELDIPLDKQAEDLSGGELQRLAIAACLSKDADIYLLDEPSAFLDASERLKIARKIRDTIKEKKVVVVEHDLAVLDLLTDMIHIFHGESGAYGAVSHSMGSRVGINEYLDGYLSKENLRIRDESIHFDWSGGEESGGDVVFEYPELEKNFNGFSLKVEPGDFHESEVLGILGQNALGKTTFARILAGELDPDNTELNVIDISYKPQNISAPKGKTEFLLSDVPKTVENSLTLEALYEKQAEDLSGGELQRLAIAACLSKDADIYLLDEPSAFLDVESRIDLARLLRRFSSDKASPIIVIDHDLLFLSYISDRVLIFQGESGKKGLARKPKGVYESFNTFLKMVNITFRREPTTGRPRPNKPQSTKDKEQKQKDKYYEI